MRYGISIPADDLAIANSPEIGGESRVKLSYDEIGLIGEISQPAAASGTLSTYNSPAFTFDSILGNDLALVTKNGVKSSVDIVVTLNVTFADDTTGQAAATFQVPSFAKDQTKNLPMGLAVDLIGTGGNSAKRIKAVSGIQSVTGGAKGNRFEIVELPEDWIELGCARNKSETLPTPKSLPIPCGLNASAFTKAGRGDPGELQLEALNFTYGDGLARFNGHRASVMVETVKDGRVMTERSVYGGFRANVNTPRTDGDDEVLASATGNFETFAKFV